MKYAEAEARQAHSAAVYAVAVGQEGALALACDAVAGGSEGEQIRGARLDELEAQTHLYDCAACSASRRSVREVNQPQPPMGRGFADPNSRDTIQKVGKLLADLSRQAADCFEMQNDVREAAAAYACLSVHLWRAEQTAGRLGGEDRDVEAAGLEHGIAAHATWQAARAGRLLAR